MIFAIAARINEGPAIMFLAIVFGILAISIRKFMIILSTSFFGAELIAPVVSHSLDIGDRNTQLLVELALVVIGVAFQYRSPLAKKNESNISATSESPVASTKSSGTETESSKQEG